MRIYEYHMRNLRVSYGIYKPPPDQSDRSICYNYDLTVDIYIYTPVQLHLARRLQRYRQVNCTCILAIL